MASTVDDSVVQQKGKTSNNKDAALIGGIVAGVVLFLLLAIMGCFLCIKFWKKKVRMEKGLSPIRKNFDPK
jgi:uncharacterized membrane-anchored protein